MSREENNEKHAEAKKARHEQIMQSREILERIKRIDTEDRVIFAKNIGKMLKSCQKKDNSLTPRKLIKEAFKEEDRQETFIKRRKEFIHLPGEKENNKYLSTWLPYKSILNVLVKKIKQNEDVDEDNSERIAYLRIFEGSSFDVKNSRREHIDNEFLTTIKDAFEKIIKTTTSSVDIEWMEIFLEDFMMGNEEFDECISISDVGYSDSNAFNYAPTVTLGKYLWSDSISNTIDITINKKTKDITIEDIKNALIEETTFEDWDDIYLFILEDTFDNMLKKNSKTTTGDSVRVDREINLDLKIMRDINLDKWEVMFTRSRLNYHNDSASICKMDSDLSEIDVSDDDFQIYAKFIEEKNNSTKYRIFSLNNYDLDYDLNRWYDNEPLYPACEHVDFYDFLKNPRKLITGENSFYQYESRIHKEGFVKAPSGSIASDILSNILYADDNEKIQNLLIADIKEKYTRLKKHHDDGIKEFDKRFSIFLNNK